MAVPCPSLLSQPVQTQLQFYASSQTPSRQLAPPRFRRRVPRPYVVVHAGRALQGVSPDAHSHLPIGREDNPPAEVFVTGLPARQTPW